MRRLSLVSIFLIITLLCLLVSPVKSFYETTPESTTGLAELCNQCPTNCTCVGVEAKCTDISVIPKCFPGNDTEVLIIQNSPRLYYIPPDAFQAHGNNLLQLKLQTTGIGWVDDAAFAGLVNLRVFEMSSASLLANLNSSEIFSDLVSLQTLNLSNNMYLVNIHPKLFSRNRLLETIDLSGCDILRLSEDIFENLCMLAYLNLDSNEYLLEIPRYTFANLGLLKEIRLGNCGLTVLYPEYFEAAYASASLQYVNTLSNNFYCDTKMCDFVEWMNRNPSFESISDLGFCLSPPHFQFTSVSELSEKNVCVETGILTYVWIIIAAALLLTCCFALAFKNRFIGLCRGNRIRNQNLQSRGRTNAAANTSDDVSSISENSDLFAKWRMMGSEPPSYGSLGSKSKTSSKILNQECEDNDSVEDVPPPPYVDTNNEIC